VDSMFDVEKGVGTIVIAKPLDAEQRSFYNLTVEVTDGTNIAYTQVNTHTLTHSLTERFKFTPLQYSCTPNGGATGFKCSKHK